MAPLHHDTEQDWLGRLVRVLVVFRLLILLVTLALVSPYRYSGPVAIAVLAAAALSYLPLRHWPLVRRSLDRHCLYAGAELTVSMSVLAMAGARSSLFFFTLGTAVLAGALYGRRGALPFTLAFVAAYELITLAGLPAMHAVTTAQTVVLAALYPVAVGAGVAARTMIERGARTEELLYARSRALAVEQERLAVARELHDSLAKTVEGLAMTAMALPRRCERDPEAAAMLATVLAADAQRAALEARALMSGLRSDSDGSLIAQLTARGEALGARSGVKVSVECPDESIVADLSPDVRYELVRIFAEAVINAVNHGRASHVRAAVVPAPSGRDRLVMTVADDGHGMTGPVDLDALRERGHYGLVGMVERAGSFGGSVRFASATEGGLMIDVQIPAAGAGPVRFERQAMEVAA